MCYIRTIAPNFVLWVGASFIYDKALGVPRFSYSNPQPGLATVAECDPAILKKLPKAYQGDLIYLHAQEHYVEVKTTAGSRLVSYKFRDALKDVECLAGVRVHRSYWVASDAAALIEEGKHRNYVVLTDGEQIPIGRTYLKDARLAAGLMP